MNFWSDFTQVIVRLSLNNSRSASSICRQLILTLGGLFTVLPSACAEEILMYIRDDVYTDYIQFIDGRDVYQIDNFSGKKIRRDVVDMILAQQALSLGGFKHTFRYAPGKLNYRNTKMLQMGQLLMSFDSYWLSDARAIKGDVLISKPVIRNGEYLAGIYTSPSNTDVLAVKSLQQLAQFTGVSTPKWRTDWNTMQSFRLKELIREDEWFAMARMVHFQYVDFLLMAFNSTPDKSFTMNKINLVPIKNIGVVLKDSRHFVISKKHPFGEQAFQAIEVGLKKLREKNHIVKAYTQAGFFIDRNTLTIIN